MSRMDWNVQSEDGGEAVKSHYIFLTRDVGEKKPVSRLQNGVRRSSRFGAEDGYTRHFESRWGEFHEGRNGCQCWKLQVHLKR